MAAKRPPSEPTTEPEKARPGPRLGCRFYKNEGGTEPVRDWLLGLDAEVRKEIGSDIKNVQWRWPLSKSLVDSFGEGLYEVRTTYDKNIYRVLFCIVGSTIVVDHLNPREFSGRRLRAPRTSAFARGSSGGRGHELGLGLKPQVSLAGDKRRRPGVASRALQPIDTTRR